MHAQVVLFDGFDPLDAIAPYEVLHAAGLMTDGDVTVELVSAEGPRAVPSGVGLTLAANAALNPAVADVVLLPGAAGRVGADDDPDADPDPAAPPTIPMLLARTLDTPLPDLMRTAFEEPATLVATVCGGSLLLAMAGLLEGRHAVTHRLGMDVLGATGASAVQARVVDDGDLISAGGVTSGLDLGLYLLERCVGPQIAIAVEQLFEHERRGTTWTAAGRVPSAL